MFQHQINSSAGKCTVVMERSLNEQWGVTIDGELDSSDYRGDGGASEFMAYLCMAHGFDCESWGYMPMHVQENATTMAEALAEEKE